MNYGGEYRNTRRIWRRRHRRKSFHRELLAGHKEQRFPDIAYNGNKRIGLRRRSPDRARSGVSHELLGHLGLLDISDGVILPGYAGYPDTAASSLYPMNADVAILRTLAAPWRATCIPSMTTRNPS